MIQFEVDGPYLIAFTAERGVIGKVRSQDLAPLGCGADFFLCQHKEWFITFETFSTPLKKEEVLIESSELGRYPRKGRTFLGIGASFYVLKDGPWYVTVDRKSKGIARDNMAGDFLGIEMTLVNIPKKEYKELLAFRQGSFVRLLDPEFNLISMRHIDL